MNKLPAVFLDRDGTIIEDVGYIRKPSNVIFYPSCFKALSILQEFFLLFIVTNQSGIAKGLIKEEEVNLVNNYIVEQFKQQGIHIRGLYVCPHKTEDNCICKKPSPYFINQAANQYNINLSASYLIGDHPSDTECAINSGITAVYLLSGHGTKHKSELKHNVQICENIYDAAKYIVDLNLLDFRKCS